MEKVKCREVEWSGVKVLGTGCLSLLEDIRTIWSFTASTIFFGLHFYHCIYGCMYCMLLFNFVYYVFLLCLSILIMYVPF